MVTLQIARDRYHPGRGVALRDLLAQAAQVHVHIALHFRPVVFDAAVIRAAQMGRRLTADVPGVVCWPAITVAGIGVGAPVTVAQVLAEPFHQSLETSGRTATVPAARIGFTACCRHIPLYNAKTIEMSNGPGHVES